MKVELCNKAIHLIRENHLSIKYGWKDGVLYFNIRDKQFSFHRVSHYGMKYKKYDGTWIGTRNPLEFGEMYRLSKTMKKKIISSRTNVLLYVIIVFGLLSSR
jgi:hypothetical protein